MTAEFEKAIDMLHTLCEAERESCDEDEAFDGMNFSGLAAHIDGFKVAKEIERITEGEVLAAYKLSERRFSLTFAAQAKP